MFFLILLFPVSTAFSAVRDWNKFVLDLGVPQSSYCLFGVKNQRTGDLKSDILPLTESFAVSQNAAQLVFDQFKVYPVVVFNDLPHELYSGFNTAGIPDVMGNIKLSYANGGELNIHFQEFDQIKLYYKGAGAGEEFSSPELLWVNSEFLSMIIYSFSERKPTRWNWFEGNAIPLKASPHSSLMEINQRIAELQLALAEAQEIKANLERKPAVESKD